MFSPPHAILLQRAKFRHNQTTHGSVMTSYRFYKMAAIESEIYFRFRLCDGTCFRKWTTICIPNFDEICQCTAQIKLLPVSGMEGRHIWIVFPVSIFYLCVVIRMSFSIRLPNFVAIRRLAASYRFFKMAAMKSEIYFRVQVSYWQSFKKVDIHLLAKF